MDKNTMKTFVKVHFKDSKLDYETEVNSTNSDYSLESYFVGNIFNLPVLHNPIEDNCHTCISITITRK